MLELYNPFGIMTHWTRAYVSVAETAVATTLGTMAACCAQVSSALSCAATASQCNVPAAAAKSSGFAPKSSASAMSSLSVPFRAGSEPARSWYHPPYRSPFDPAFWLTPGADWDPLMLMMGPFHPFAKRSVGDPTTLLWAIVVPQRTAAAMSLLAPFAAFQPWVGMLGLGWRDSDPDEPRTPAWPAPATDHARPRATYRTDGGHAAGMVTWLPVATASPRAAERDPQLGARSDAIEDWPFLFAPWFRQ